MRRVASVSVSVSAEIKSSVLVSVSVQVGHGSFGFGRNWKKWIRTVSTLEHQQLLMRNTKTLCQLVILFSVSDALTQRTNTVNIKPTNHWESYYIMKQTASSSAYSIVWTLEFMHRVPSPGFVSNICSIREPHSDKLAWRCFWLSLLQTLWQPTHYSLLSTTTLATSF